MQRTDFSFGQLRKSLQKPFSLLWRIAKVAWVASFAFCTLIITLASVLAGFEKLADWWRWLSGH